MGNRTTCQLAISGKIAEADLPILVAALEDAGYCDANTPDIEATLRRSEAWFVFYEMNYGEMERELDEAPKSLRLSYAWNWDAPSRVCSKRCQAVGGGFGAGVCLYNAETDEIGRFDCHDAEMVIRVDDLDRPDRIADVRRWSDFEKSTGAFEINRAGQGTAATNSAAANGDAAEARP